MKRKILQGICQRLRRRREEGVALISVIVILAVMATTAVDFAYNSEVDLTAATNARDDLRAHYLGRSGINLARLLLRVQERMIDPNRQLLGGLDIQISDYASLLVSAFNSREGAEALGSLFGVDSAGIKGLGVDVGTFDLQMESWDGRLNLNCGGGMNAGSPTVLRLAASLAALMLPIRYNRLFEDPDENGQYADRLEVMRAIIDWADQDTVLFGSTAVEDYRYNTGKDPYEIKNHYYDTVEELRLVKGIDDDFMAAFGNAFTVYGGCQVNVNLADAPLLAAIILQNAATPNDPALQWQNLSLLVRYVMHIRDIMGGFADIKAFTGAVESPLAASALAFAFDSTASENKGGSLPPVNGVKLNSTTLQESVVVGGARRTWEIVALASVGRVQKKIKTIWDAKYVSMQSSKYNLGSGGFLYWREE